MAILGHRIAQFNLISNQKMKVTNTKLEIQYLLLSELVNKFLDGNAKKHDIGKIVDSIQRYGFRDPLAIDATLNKGNGAVVEGNGRLEALLRLQEQGAKPPRFVAVVEGDWAIPCIVGGDSKTESEGKAYSIDHNLVGMFGGEFTALDMSKLFDEQPYLEMLEGLAKAGDLPVSVDGDDLDLLLQQIVEEVNDFEPVSEDEQGRLDEVNPITCPNCGHEFQKP